jgi:hypothetical protein
VSVVGVHDVDVTVPFVSVPAHVEHGEHARFVVGVHDVVSYLPPVHAASHGEHADAPAAEYVPSTHTEHCVDVVPIFPAVPEYVPAGQETHDVAKVVPTGQYAPTAVMYVTVLPMTTLVVDVDALKLIPLGKLIKTLEGGLADEHGDVVT